jgi:hypothetical protein
VNQKSVCFDWTVAAAGPASAFEAGEQKSLATAVSSVLSAFIVRKGNV